MNYFNFFECLLRSWEKVGWVALYSNWGSAFLLSWANFHQLYDLMEMFLSFSTLFCYIWAWFFSNLLAARYFVDHLFGTFRHVIRTLVWLLDMNMSPTYLMFKFYKVFNLCGGCLEGHIKHVCWTWVLNKDVWKKDEEF